MVKQIFYSWQSDLKNSTNRTFIENCIKTAITELKADKDFKLEVALDRDTKGLTGTPDILNSIFDKISNSELFIADISIINKNGSTRKTPNPNVLIELGYAARALGWDKVICIYNLDEGSFEDLPFDLRVRRPLSYSLASEQKKSAEKRIAKIIADTVRQLQNEGKLINEVNDYIKVQFDSQVLFIINQLLKILYGYEYSIVMKLDSIQKFLNLEKKDVRDQFIERKLLGFQIFKSLKYARVKLEELIHQPIVVNELSRKTLTPIISLIKHIGTYESINDDRVIDNLFIDLKEIERLYVSLKATEISDKNAHQPHRYILGLRGDKGQFAIQDFGDFIYLDKARKQLNYFKINPDRVDLYLDCILEFNSIINDWVDNTGGEIIIDNQTNFKLHREKIA